MKARSLLLLVLLGSPAGAHPHIFIDGGADFLFAPDGRLQAIRVTWIYDQYYSLTSLLDYGLDPEADGVLTDTEKAYLADSQTAHWIEGYDGDGYLFNGDERLALGKPQSASADLIDGSIRITFERRLEQPFRPATGTVFKAYDPSFYVAYSITNTPEIAAEAGCTAQVVKFDPDAASQAQLDELSQLGVYDSPDDNNIGALFSDRIELTCD